MLLGCFFVVVRACVCVCVEIESTAAHHRLHDVPLPGRVLHVPGQLVHTVHRAQVAQVCALVQSGQCVLHGELLAPLGRQEPSDALVQLVAAALHAQLPGHAHRHHLLCHVGAQRPPHSHIRLSSNSLSHLVSDHFQRSKREYL